MRDLRGKIRGVIYILSSRLGIGVPLEANRRSYSFIFVVLVSFRHGEVKLIYIVHLWLAKIVNCLQVCRVTPLLAVAPRKVDLSISTNYRFNSNRVKFVKFLKRLVRYFGEIGKFGKGGIDYYLLCFFFFFYGFLEISFLKIYRKTYYCLRRESI